MLLLTTYVIELTISEAETEQLVFNKYTPNKTDKIQPSEHI